MKEGTKEQEVPRKRKDQARKPDLEKRTLRAGKEKKRYRINSEMGRPVTRANTRTIRGTPRGQRSEILTQERGEQARPKGGERGGKRAK